MSPDRNTNSAYFSFHQDLNIFLGKRQLERQNHYRFGGQPSIKDAIEAQGIPHPEVDLIVVNGVSVGFSYQLKDGDQIDVYPPEVNIEVSPRITLREPLSGEPRFVVDANLGKLAKLLRMLGFNTLYNNHISDEAVANLAYGEARIALTRDRLLLHRKAITYGYWVRSQQPDEQVQEVIRRFGLAGHFKPLCRCMNCNGVIQPVAKEVVVDRLEPKTRRYYDEFYICPDCEQVYWKGSHFERLGPKVKKTMGGIK